MLAAFRTRETDDQSDQADTMELLRLAVQRALDLELFSFGQALWNGERGWRPNRALAWACWQVAARAGLPVAEETLSERAAVLEPEERLAAAIVAKVWAACRAEGASGAGR